MDSNLESPMRPSVETPGHPVFLLLESNPIIASDIVNILELSCECHVIHVSDPSDVLDALLNTPKLTAAFLEMSAADLEGSKISELLRRQKAQIVLTHGEEHRAAAQKQGWHMLIRPFTEQMVRDVLDKLHAPR